MMASSISAGTIRLPWLRHGLLKQHSQACRRVLGSPSPPSYSFWNSSPTRLLSDQANKTPSVPAPTVLQGYDLRYEECNVPSHIAAKVGRNLHLQVGHPLHTIQQIISDHLVATDDFVHRSNLNPIVSTEANFDSLLIPTDHVSRSYSDTYYLNSSTCLRTHTSAHQVELLQQGHTKFLVTGDVYRRDEIDSSHYPIFHQMEGVKVFEHATMMTSAASSSPEQLVLEDLQNTLSGLATKLFGDVPQQWVDAYFPFTNPSLELEILYQGQWLEVLGCGVMQPSILRAGGYDPTKHTAWAFGLGLERLAMVLFDIPDIRLFWSEDPRFLRQFQPGTVTKFLPYSKYPPCYKDISFWIVDPTNFHSNDLYEIVRSVGGDWIEHVVLVDQFVHPKTKTASHCYRITYQSMDRSLTNEEIDVLQEQVRHLVQTKLPSVQLR